MQAPLDIRYAGVNIGRAQEVRSAEGEAAFFLSGKEPMPVGTVLRLRSTKGETPARVVRAIESPDPAICGMEVRPIGDEEAVAADVIPPPAPAKPKPSPAPPAAAPPETPTPTEPDVAAIEAKADRPPPAPAPEGSAVPEAVPVAVGSSLTGALAKAAASTDPADAPTPPPAAPPTPTNAAPTRTPEEVPAAASTAASDDPDIVITNTPPPISPGSVVPVVAPFEPDPGPTPPPPVAEAAAPAREATAEGSQAIPSDNGERSQAASDENGQQDGEEAQGSASPAEEMPTARPISGPNSRRKTKRRRSS